MLGTYYLRTNCTLGLSDVDAKRAQASRLPHAAAAALLLVLGLLLYFGYAVLTSRHLHVTLLPALTHCLQRRRRVCPFFFLFEFLM